MWWEHLLILLGCVAGTIGVVLGAVALTGYEYDRHPWVRKWLDMQARMRGYVPPEDEPDITPEYLDQVPGGWDKL